MSIKFPDYHRILVQRDLEYPANHTVHGLRLLNSQVQQHKVNTVVQLHLKSFFSICNEIFSS